MSKASTNLPPGWSSVTVSELMVETGTVNPAQAPERQYELWSVPAFPTGTPEYVHGVEVGSNKQRVAPGDVLLCKINPRINRVWIVGERGPSEQIASTEWIVLRCPGFPPKFIMYQLREEDFRRRLCADVSGVGGSLTRARPKIVGELALRLAPLKEQERIIGRIEELQARTRKAREALETIPDLLDQLRQSVLAAAFRGDLTKEWRAKHSDVEPASELLTRIRIERRKRWEESELEKLKAKGLAGEKLDSEFAKRRKQYKEPLPVDTTDLPDLPEGWIWATVDEISDSLQYGSSSKSSKSGNVPVLRMGNLQDGEIDLLDLVFTSNDAEIRKYSLSPDTVLFNRTNSPELVGKTAIYRGQREAVFAGYLIRVQHVPQLLASYLNLMMNSPFIKKLCLTVKSDAVSQSNINATKLSAFPIPLCSQGEQAALVSIAEPVLAKARKKRTEVTHLLNSLTGLDQSILSKAFRGELVPQDPNDEPAEMLLTRIRAARTTECAGPKKPSTGRARKMIKISKDSVKETLPELGKEKFSFEDLRQRFPGDYDRLKDIIFALLDEAEPSLTQVFDPDAKEIRFVRSVK